MARTRTTKSRTRATSRASEYGPRMRLRIAAEYMGLSPDWLKGRFAAGEIRAIKTNYALLFDRAELDRYLAEHTIAVKSRKSSKGAR